MATPTALLRRILQNGAQSAGQAIAKMDGWVNQLTGLGDSLRDKSLGSSFYRQPVLTVDECEALFHHDDLAQVICTAVPEDALREGLLVSRSLDDDGELDLPDVELEDPERAPENELDRDPSAPEATPGRRQDADLAVDVAQDSQAWMDQRVRELQLADRLQEAMTWGRTFGGSAILLMVEGSGAPDTPLVDELVTRVSQLAVVDRGDLSAFSWYDDPSQEKYGQVELWSLNLVDSSGAVAVTSVRIHESRLVMFRGAMTSRRERQRNGGWDHSVLQKCINILRQTNQAWDSVIHMMNDLSQAVFKIQGLIDAIAENDHSAITRRMAVVDMVRSVARAIVLDAEEEDFSVVERGAVTGVDGLLDKTFLRLSAAGRMPVFRMFGQSPAGLNATGAVDLRWWYDTVRTSQTHEIKPRAERIIRLVAHEPEFLGEDPSQWEVSFPSLWQMTPTEEAALRASIAATDKTYIDAQVILPEEATLARFRGGKYNGLGPIKVDVEARRRMLAAELVKAQEKATKPDPVPPPGPGFGAKPPVDDDSEDGPQPGPEDDSE